MRSTRRRRYHLATGFVPSLSPNTTPLPFQAISHMIRVLGITVEKKKPPVKDRKKNLENAKAQLIAFSQG